MNQTKSFSPIGQVIKISTSNMDASVFFYTEALHMTIDDRYTLHMPPNEFGTYSYVQLNFPWPGNNVAIGLFKDIDKPFPANDLNNPKPGTVPTFLGENIMGTREDLIAKQIPVSEIVSNTSDKGYVDQFAFFADPDNNLLCIRQDMN